MTASHPAPFSEPIMDLLKSLIADWEGPILDPYAGIGRVHELGRDDTWGIEIEPEWAMAHDRTLVGDSSKIVATSGDLFCANWNEDPAPYLPRPNGIVTSPDYGNRMADQYLGTPEERRLREEEGVMPRRRSYAISLGRKVSEGSAAKYGFGPEYQELHRRIFTAVTDVCNPGARLALNVSDHFAAYTRIYVTSWWVEMIAALGWNIERMIPVGTRRFRDGANSDLRVDAESIILATLKGAA
jgi:hypothetical protein